MNVETAVFSAQLLSLHAEILSTIRLMYSRSLSMSVSLKEKEKITFLRNRIEEANKKIGTIERELRNQNIRRLNFSFYRSLTD